MLAWPAGDSPGDSQGLKCEAQRVSKGATALFVAFTGTYDVPPSMRRYQPRLTAANYRYFIRGQNSRAAATDYRVRKQRQVKLQPYDKMLRQFRWAGVQGKRSRWVGDGLQLRGGKETARMAWQ